jgi:hypothetical protein
MAARSNRSRANVRAMAALLALAITGARLASAESPFARGRQLPEDRSTYWSIGVGFERFEPTAIGASHHVGLTAVLRWAAFGPHTFVMVKPNPDGYEDSRFLAGLGLRGYVSPLGISLSYGVASHAEVSLAEHFWLAHVTPLELGAVLYQANSLDIELFLGARRVFAGELIDHFLIDPNGFDNDNAADELERARTNLRWGWFARLVFARRVQ